MKNNDEYKSELCEWCNPRYARKIDEFYKEHHEEMVNQIRVIHDWHKDAYDNLENTLPFDAGDIRCHKLVLSELCHEEDIEDIINNIISESNRVDCKPTRKFCPKCGNFLCTSDLIQYDYVCFHCDENFDECEVREEAEGDELDAEYLRIARELCVNLDKNEGEIQFCAIRLRELSEELGKTKDEIEDMCWEDSSAMFNLIY